MGIFAKIDDSSLGLATKHTSGLKYKERKASRAVVFDPADGGMYLMHVKKHSYHKLPGGGLDPGDDPESALARELLEELGLRAEIIADIGIITEIRNEHALAQESHCFIAKQVGNLGKNSLTTKEKGQGFEIVKVKSIDAAIETLMNDKPNNYEGKFISHRDLKILLEAKNYKI